MGADGKERMTTTKTKYMYSEQAILHLSGSDFLLTRGLGNESGSCFEAAMLI
jgi:hypothetical protein